MISAAVPMTFAGVVIEMWDWSVYVTVAGVPPMVAVLVLLKPLPTIATTVPPAMPPVLGVIDVIPGPVLLT